MNLRAQVTLLGVGTATLVIALASVPIALLLRHNAYADAQQHATYAAQSTADYMTAATYDAGRLDSYLHRLNGRTSSPVTVVENGDREVGAGLTDTALHSALRTRMPELGDDDADNLGQVSQPHATVDDDLRLVQVFCHTHGGGGARVVAVVDQGTVSSEIRQRTLAVAGVAVLLLFLAWLAADLLGRRIVRPLRLTADTAGALRGGDLNARAPVAGPPEVARVASELNELAGRIGELLNMERENAADLSHRLRTPLTAVRLGVEALPDDPQRSELERHVAALERSLTQLIRAARRGDREGLHPTCDAAEVARERIAFWRPLVEDQGRSWDVSLPDGAAPVRLVDVDLSSALDALIENAVAHTDDGVPLALRVVPDADAWQIELLDQGPGIPPKALTRGRSDRGSSGLGLDIARSAAEASGGSLELVSDGEWRGVRLRLGAAPQ